MNKFWWKEAVAYQIYPRSFMDSNGDGIGDILGIISKLDYLKDLGIDVIWVCPMFQSPNDDNGYDISDYHKIMAEFGTMQDFNLLLKEVHSRGMKLILDLVINHTSDEHPWFIESRSRIDNPKRDWYIWRDGKEEEEPNNWESVFGGSAWELDEQSGQYFLHIFSKKQPDLNWENKEVRESLYEMINWWLKQGIDGFRVDAISHIKKEAGLVDMPNPKGLKYVASFEKHMNVKGIHSFLQELKEETFSKYDIMTVGEANGVQVEDIELWVDEKQGKFNMVFQFEHLKLWDAEVKKDLDIVGLKKILSSWQKGVEGKGWNALFIENHDQPRRVSTWGNDQEYWRESATALGAMYFLMQGTPFIYQGQEIGMTNVKFKSIDDYDDVATKNLYHLKRADGVPHEEIMEIIWASSRDNSRTPMQWSSEVNAGFTSQTPWLMVNPNYKDVNVENQQNDEKSILNFYKKMIALKKGNEVFTYGTYDLLVENDPQIYAYTRTLNGNKIVVMANLSNQPASVNEKIGLFKDNHELLLNNIDISEDESLSELVLKPYEARVYRV
ncbi:alpha-glucosidase [Neobacillus sp. PS3-40]|uniref:glycoside hydrolase family 13 protein n=1 Tax=Neobacillus sp. PS3-40 TaxID=3070679 RepID=UPI0027DF6174|nr:alpha-glucosidase [Neobacillus sp. PS3-40]WML42832.1 alpha-glucosidase [Neobacillus sp. PS3-40]